MTRTFAAAFFALLKRSMRSLTISGLLALAACSFTHPVHGVEDNGVQFLGTATGYLNGDGDIQMTTDDGRNCTGTYHWTGSSEAANANGTFQCDGGVTGTFASEGTAASSTGFGRTSDGHKFKFYTGQVAEDGTTTAHSAAATALAIIGDGMGSLANSYKASADAYGNAAAASTPVYNPPPASLPTNIDFGGTVPNTVPPSPAQRLLDCGQTGTCAGAFDPNR